MKTLLPSGPISRALIPTSNVAVILCGWWLVALSVISCFEMLGRKVLGFSLQGVDEIGAYTYAIVSTLGAASALITRSHVRVDFLLTHFQSRTRATLNVLAIVSLAALGALFAWRGFNVVRESVDFGSRAATPLATPMWVPQSIWLAGYFLFALVAWWAALDAIRLFVQRRIAELNDRFDPQTLEEGIKAETDLRFAKIDEGTVP